MRVLARYVCGKKEKRNNEKMKASFKKQKWFIELAAFSPSSSALYNIFKLIYEGRLHIFLIAKALYNSELVYEGTARVLLIAKGIKNDSFDLRLFVREIWVGIY